MQQLGAFWEWSVVASQLLHPNGYCEFNQASRAQEWPLGSPLAVESCGVLKLTMANGYRSLQGSRKLAAVILAGGKGTRLKPFTMTIPKPLLPLGDMPIVEIVIGQLVSAGVSRIVLTLGHMAPLLMACIGDGDRWGIKIESVIEREPLGTAGSLRAVDNLEENFLVMNADLLTTIDYADMFDFHIRHNSIGTIGLSKREVNIDYGVVRTNSAGLLEEYIEKPTIPYSVSMGINILSRRCLQFIPATGKFDMPDLMLAMHRAGHAVHCYETDCYWKDIGRFDDYQQASEDFVRDPSRFLGSRVVTPS